MEHYHQPYSEIKNMLMKDVQFLIELYNTEAEFEKREIEKMNRMNKRPSRRFR